MKQVLDQKLLSISKAATTIPTRPHVATVWRWILRGCRGHKLQSWLIGGQRFTSREAIEEFLSRINGGEVSSTSIRTPRQRQRAIEAAEKELDGLGL